ncbi:MAG: DUF6941 family protein [Planctomycetota bacterium]|jgi:hypothetical protein
MRITWLCVCEQIVVMTDGRPYAMGIYTGIIPWAPPGVQLPISVLFHLKFRPDDDKARKLTFRLIDPDGKTVAEPHTMVGPNASAGQATDYVGSFGGPANIQSQGDYEVILVLDGQPLDDAPTWLLRFRDLTQLAKNIAEGRGPTPPPEDPSPGSTEESGPAG